MLLKSAVVVFAICLIGTACNAADEPVSYSVYGVPPNDTLALRANPNATSPKVADIPHDASDLHVTGSTTASGDWAEIQFQGRRGWVNSRYLAFGSGAGASLPALLECSGTEPFWAINVSPGRTSDLNIAHGKDRITHVYSRITQATSAMNRNDIWVIRSRDNRTESSLIVRKESCSDGMSERDYPYSAVALSVPGNGIRAGCCKAPGAQ